MPVYEYDTANELKEILSKIETLEKFVRFPEGDVEVPAGIIVARPVAGGLPSDWLLCDGRAVSRTTYADLYAVVGTTYGNGNGSTTFNVPDLVGRQPLGKAASGTGDALNDSGGSYDHTHTVPSHSHGSDGGHTLSSAGGSHVHGNVAHSHFASGEHTEVGVFHSHNQGNTGSASPSHDHDNTSTHSDDHTHGAAGAVTVDPQRVGTFLSLTGTPAADRRTHGHNIADVFFATARTHTHSTTTTSNSHSHSNPTTSSQFHTHGADGLHSHGSADSHNHGSAGSSHSHGSSAGAHTHPSSTPSVGAANPPVTTVTWWIKA